MLVCAAFSQAQFTSQPDTVCAGETSVRYTVGNTGNIFYWSTANASGVQNPANNSFDVRFDWANSSGYDTIKVVEVSVVGSCKSDTAYMVVYRHKPTAVISGTASICQFTATTGSPVTITMTGVPPFTVTYNNGVTNVTVTTNSNVLNVNTGNLTTTGQHNITLVSMEDVICSNGAKSGAAVITVNPKPTMPTITRY